MEGIQRAVGSSSLLSIVLYLSPFPLRLFQTTETKWLNISVSIEGKGRLGDRVKKSLSRGVNKVVRLVSGNQR